MEKDREDRGAPEDWERSRDAEEAAEIRSDEIPEDEPEYSAAEAAADEIFEAVYETAGGDISEAEYEDAAEAFPEMVNDEITEDISETEYEDAAEAFPDRMNDEVTEDISEAEYEDAAEVFPETVNEETAGEIPGDEYETAGEEIPEAVNEDLADEAEALDVSEQTGAFPEEKSGGTPESAVSGNERETAVPRKRRIKPQGENAPRALTPEEQAMKARRERAERAAAGRSLAVENGGQASRRKMNGEAARVGSSPTRKKGPGEAETLSGQRTGRTAHDVSGQRGSRPGQKAAPEEKRVNQQRGEVGKRRPQRTGTDTPAPKRKLVSGENGGVRTEEQRRRIEQRKARQVSGDTARVRQERARTNAPAKKQPKKKKGVLVGLIAAIAVLALALILCIWEMIGAQNGTKTPLSLFDRQKETAPVFFTEAPKETTAAAPETAAANGEAEAESGEGLTEKPAGSAVPAQTEQPAGKPTEAQTWQEDANGLLIIPEKQEGTFETEPAWENTLVRTGDALLDEANRQAAMYDYDTAISMLQSADGYQGNQTYLDAVASYESRKAEASVPYAAMDKITHVFFHSLIVDTRIALNRERAVSKWDGMNKMEAYNSEMTTVTEFCRILDEMYRRGFVLVGIHDIAGFVDNGDGTRSMQYKKIYLPAGKTPFVLSVDDTSYYLYMEGHGFASKLVVDANGKVVNEYVHEDGSVSYGAYDVLPILEDFITAHPDFCYRGARGTMALTGYDGILGYRTSDYWFNWNCDYIKPTSLDQRSRLYYNNENIEADKQTAKQVADAIKAMGWTFASHTWGHRHIQDDSYEQIAWDTDMWRREVEPLVGPTDIIIFAFGQDLDSWRGYAADNQKYQLLKSYGFDYYCNVDSSQYWIQIGANKDYFRMGRRNLDGYRMWEAIASYAGLEGGLNRVDDLFDARAVFDWARETPVLLR